MKDYTYCDTDCRDCLCMSAVPDTCNTRCKSCKWVSECPCCNKRIRKQLEEYGIGGPESIDQEKETVELDLSLISSTAPWQQRLIPRSLVRQMANSLHQWGQLRPVLVRRRPWARGTTVYQPVDGFLRIKGAALDGWTSIRAIVRDMDVCQASVEYLDINMAEREMSWEEVTLGILVVQNALTRRMRRPCDSRHMARVLGRSKDWVNDHKRALRVVQAHSIPKGAISHYKLLRPLGHSVPFAVEEAILQGIINEKWTFERVQQEVNKRAGRGAEVGMPESPMGDTTYTPREEKWGAVEASPSWSWA